MENLNWNSPIALLFGKGRKSKSLSALENHGIKTILDLLWILPKSIEKIPPVASFKNIKDEQLFKGQGRIISIRKSPSYASFRSRRGKRGVSLFNLSAQVQDLHSNEILNLKWFNAYPSIYNSLSQNDKGQGQGKQIEFHGLVSLYQGQKQIINPKFTSQIKSIKESYAQLVVTYPSLSTLSASLLKKVFQKIPQSLWDQESLPDLSDLLDERGLLSCTQAFRILHGVEITDDLFHKKALCTLAYLSFFKDQLKILARRHFVRQNKSVSIKWDEGFYHRLLKDLPFELTPHQVKVIEEIKQDINCEQSMMRLLQGDVGSGKTVVCQLISMMCIHKSYQAALMCPTEALAYQHFLGFKELMREYNFSLALLTSSTSKKERRSILEGLKSGEINFVIGTHSLIQSEVQFKKLAFITIDEQHKFGVQQRLDLSKKAPGTHCLIMSATPIPRSLSLTRYGDLDISLISQLPQGRIPIKTKIVKPSQFNKFLSFLKTRLSLGEQAYLVTAAIEENPESDLLNINQVFAKFKTLFPQYTLAYLHGKMKAQEKELVLSQFLEQKIDLLISTSVIEVGINSVYASTIGILNPERFGLSSLHQLRGRVGRGQKASFCFLILDKDISETSLQRLKVIENSTDGFIIAEEDLRIRGEGDLFGKEQSGTETKQVFSSEVFSEQFYQAREDTQYLKDNPNPWFTEKIQNILTDLYVQKTI